MIAGEAAGATVLEDTRAGADHLRVVVPEVPLGATTLTLTTALGTPSEETLAFEVESGVRIKGVRPTKIDTAAPPPQIVVVGSGFLIEDQGGGAGESPAEGDLRAVELDHTPLVVSDGAWTSERITATLAEGKEYPVNPQAELIVQNNAGRRSAAWTMVVEN